MIISSTVLSGGRSLAAQHAICIDPGHQGSWVDMSEPEPMAPGSSQMKAKATTGTQGSATGVPEYQLNLDISLALQKELEERGYRIVLTRDNHDAKISNSERALLASEEQCDVMVRIHANGSEDSSVHGALAMVMSPDNPYVGELFEESERLARNILDSYCSSTGFEKIGVQYYDNMTGINWSRVPVMILEMGYMTNAQEDTLMEDPQMQENMVKGIADGIDLYFGDHAEPAPEKKPLMGVASMMQQDGAGKEKGGMDAYAAFMANPMMTQLYEQYLLPKEQQGQTWALSLEILSKEDSEEELYEYHGDILMQSASVIKVFIMGAVYDWICYPKDEAHTVRFQESYDGQLRSLLEAMITVSDNSAANSLIEILGEGDFFAGAETIREFCMEYGYVSTSIGRRFMESNPMGDNYTSAADCRKILSDLYHGTCVNEEASEKMLSILKGQTIRHKIPAGLPAGVLCANKTGEMPEGYGLGCIENDIAIVYGPECDYVLCVLSNDLQGDNSGAQQTIVSISSVLAQDLLYG